MHADEVALLNRTVACLAEAHDGAELTKALDEFGWQDALSNHVDVAVPAVFGAQGRSGTWSAALHDVLAGGLSELGSWANEHTCVVLPRPRSLAPGAGSLDDVRVQGVLLGPRTETSSYAIPVSSDDGAIRAVVTVPAHALLVAHQRGLDPGLGVFEVSGAVRAADVVAEGRAAAEWWSRAEARARLALSHCIAGGMRTMLELAREHANQRAQFGRLIGTFQAVRHKLAEAYVAVIAVESAAAAAWEADDLPLAAATAKLVASRAVTTAAAHTQQVLAGIGFTAEHRFHHFMKRIVVLDRVLGSTDELAPIVGRQLIGRATAPRLVEL